MNIKEILRCAKDPAEFIERLSLMHPKHGVIPFIMNRDQIGWLKQIEEARVQKKGLVTINGDRQRGSTSLGIAYAYWNMQFRDYQYIYWGADRKDSAEWAMEKFRFMHDRSMAKYEILSPFIKNNKFEVKTETGGFRTFWTDSAMRGLSPTILFLDNVKMTDAVHNLINVCSCSAVIVNIHTG